MSRRQQRDNRDIEWHFFSFPVFYGAAVGSLITLLLAPYLYPIVFIISLFAVSWGTAHVISHWLRRRGAERRRQREQEDERERRALARREAAASADPESASPTPPRRRRRRRRADRSA